MKKIIIFVLVIVLIYQSKIHAKYIFIEKIKIANININKNNIKNKIDEKKDTKIETDKNLVEEAETIDIDENPPQYSIKEEILKDGRIKKIITTNEEILVPEGWKRQTTNSISKIYYENTEENIELIDLKGNSTKCNIIVDNCSFVFKNMDIKD